MATQHILAPLLLLIATFQAVHGIKCYKCNSHFQEDCANETVPENYLIDCSEIHTKLTLCRKTVQTVSATGDMKASERIIRNCGYIEGKKECYRQHYGGSTTISCHCKTDGCNHASNLHLQSAFFAIPVTVTLCIFSIFRLQI